MIILGDKKKLNKLFMHGIALTLAVCLLVVFISPLSFVGANEIDDDYLFQNQWYAGEAFLNFDDTNILIKTQKIKENREFYIDNPIIIAIIDTGLDLNVSNDGEINHPVFADLIYKNNDEINGTANIDDDGNGFIDDFYGWNFVNNNNDITDNCNAGTRNGHGTHVAGIVAQQLIAYGLTDYFKILPIKAGNEKAEFSIDNTVNAIGYAINMGAKIINMSLGAYGGKGLGGLTGWGVGGRIEKAINQAYENEIIVVGASGNENKSATTTKDTFYPAGFENVYGVMAYDESDGVAKFDSGGSNMGSCYNFIAPGKNIISTVRKGEYDTKNGTSMACPMVSAMIGVLMLKYDCNASAVREVLDNYDAKKIGQYRKASLLEMLMYIPIEQIEIESLSENLSQTLDNLSAISCKATIYTRFANQTDVVEEQDGSEIYDSVKWTIENGNKIIETRMGRYLNYMPKDVGDYTITASTEHSTTQSNKIVFTINYAPLESVTISPVGAKGNIFVGNFYLYKIGGYEYVNPTQVPLFNWYVNDLLVTETQSYEFNFQPKEKGKYEIVCKLADTNEVVASYKVNVKNGAKVYCVVVLQILATVIAFAVYVIVVCLIIKEIKIKCIKAKNKS